MGPNSAELSSENDSQESAGSSPPTIDHEMDSDDHWQENLPPAAEPTTHFTTVTQEYRRKDNDNGETGERSSLLKNGALIALAALLLGIIVYSLWPASSDRLYSRINTIAQQQPEEIRRAEEDIRQFLQRFPQDPRRKEIQEHQQAIELLRLQERFERRMRFGGGRDSLTTVERTYLDCMKLATNNPQQAASKLLAFIDLFGNQPEMSATTRQCVALARRQLKELQATMENIANDQLEEIEKHLARADRLLPENREAATGILAGIIVLYADKPWAAKVVQRARDSLDDISKEKITRAEQEP